MLDINLCFHVIKSFSCSYVTLYVTFAIILKSIFNEIDPIKYVISIKNLKKKFENTLLLTRIE